MHLFTAYHADAVGFIDFFRLCDFFVIPPKQRRCCRNRRRLGAECIFLRFFRDSPAGVDFDDLAAGCSAAGDWAVHFHPPLDLIPLDTGYG